MKEIYYILVLLCSFSIHSQNNIQNVETFIKDLREIKDTDASIAFLKNSIANNTNDSILLEANYQLGRVYYKKKEDVNLAYTTFKKAMALAIKLKNTDKQIRITTNFGFINFAKNQSDSALKDYNHVLKLAHRIRNNLALSQTYFNMARVYRKEGDTLNALQLYHRSVYYGKKTDRNLRKVYNNLGVLYLKKNKDSALYYFQHSLKIAENNNNLKAIKRAYINLGHTYLNYNVYDKAFLYLNKVHKQTISTKDTRERYYTYFYLGVFHEKTSNLKQAEQFYHKTLASKFHKKDAIQGIKVLEHLIDFYKKQSKYDIAFQFQKQYHHLKDSIYSVEKNKAFNTIRTQYEVEKKDNQIVILEKEKQIASTKQKWIITSSLILLLPLVLLFLFYKSRAKTQLKFRIQEKKIHTKEKERLQKEQELAETKALIQGQKKERHRIAKELHDGIGGQLASINLGLSHINSSLNNENISTINASLSNTFTELRTLSHTLSGSYHKNKSLYTLLGELKKQYETDNVFRLELSIFPEDCLKNLEQSVLHNLYRIIQELLVNITKHAEAKLVELTFNLHDDMLIVMIEDDGIGFDVKKINNGIGLQNIKERVMTINGTLFIESTPNRGTQTILEIKLKNETATDAKN